MSALRCSNGPPCVLVLHPGDPAGPGRHSADSGPKLPWRRPGRRGPAHMRSSYLLHSGTRRKSPRRRENTRAGQANFEQPGRIGSAACTEHPQRRGRAHPGLSPQAAIRQGQATVPARSGTGSLVCQRAGTRGSAASGRTRRTVRGGGRPESGRRPHSKRAPPGAPGAEQSCPARVQR